MSNVLRLSVRDAMLRAKSSECSAGGAATTNTTSSTTSTTELKHDLNERCLLRLSPSRGKGMLLTYLDAFYFNIKPLAAALLSAIASLVWVLIVRCPWRGDANLVKKLHCALVQALISSIMIIKRNIGKNFIKDLCFLFVIPFAALKPLLIKLKF